MDKIKKGSKNVGLDLLKRDLHRNPVQMYNIKIQLSSKLTNILC